MSNTDRHNIKRTIRTHMQCAIFRFTRHFRFTVIKCINILIQSRGTVWLIRLIEIQNSQSHFFFLHKFWIKSKATLHSTHSLMQSSRSTHARIQFIVESTNQMKWTSKKKLVPFPLLCRKGAKKELKEMNRSHGKKGSYCICCYWKQSNTKKEKNIPKFNEMEGILKEHSEMNKRPNEHTHINTLANSKFELCKQNTSTIAWNMNTNEKIESKRIAFCFLCHRFKRFRIAAPN